MIGLAAICLFLVVQNSQPLSKPFTCTAAFLPLDELAAKLQTASGLKLRVDDSLRDRKVAICCQERPVQEVMHAVETAMFMEWRHEGSSYVLRLQRGVGEEEQEALAQSELDHRKGLVGTLNQLVKISKETEDELAAEGDSLRVKRDQWLQEGKDPNSIEVKENTWDLSLRNTNDETVLGDMFAGRVDPVATTLLSHDAVICCDEPFPDVLPLSKRFIEALRGPRGGDSDRYLELIKLSQGGKSIRLITRSTPKEGSMFGLNSIELQPAYSYAHAETRLDKRLATWKNDVDESILKQPIASDSFLASNPQRKMHSASEQLVDFSQRSGIPLVADAFRLAASDENPIKAKNVAGWLKQFQQLSGNRSFGFEPGYFRYSDGWLMYRYKNYWEDQPQEIPEKLLTQIRKEPKNIDSLSDFLSRLSSGQINGLDRLVLLDFEGAQELAGKKELLLLWSTLTSMQREQTTSVGLPFSDLSASQLAVARQAIANLAFENSQTYVTLLMSLLGQRVQLSNLILFCQAVAPLEQTEPDASQVRGAFDPVRMVRSTWKSVMTFSNTSTQDVAQVELKMPTP